MVFFVFCFVFLIVCLNTNTLIPCCFVFFFLIFGCAESSLLHRLFSGCVSWGCSLVAICRLLIVMVSLVAERGSWGMWA